MKEKPRPNIWVQTSTKKKCEHCGNKGQTFIAGYYHAARWGRLFGFCETCGQDGGFKKLVARYTTLGLTPVFEVSARSGYSIPQWIYETASQG
jgi:hypothetical protein